MPFAENTIQWMQTIKTEQCQGMLILNLKKNKKCGEEYDSPIGNYTIIKNVGRWGEKSQPKN